MGDRQILWATFKAGTVRKKVVADVANQKKEGDAGRRKNSPRSLNTACIAATHDSEPLYPVLERERLSLNTVPQPKRLLVLKSDARPGTSETGVRSMALMAV